MQKPEVSPEFWKNFLKKPLALKDVDAFFVVSLDSSGNLQTVTNMSTFTAMGLLDSLKARYIDDQLTRSRAGTPA